MISLVLDLLRGGVDEWRESRQQKRQVKAAANEFRQKLAVSDQDYTHEWELRQLEGKDQVLRRLSFAVIAFPLFWAAFDIDAAKQYFDALETLPDWYLSLLAVVWGGIWGASELRTLFSGKKGSNP